MVEPWGCGMLNAIGVKQLILKTGFVFHSRKRSKLSSSFTHKQPKHTALHPIKKSQPQPRGSNLLRKTSFVAIA